MMEILLLRIIGIVFLLLSLFLLIGLFVYLYQELYFRIARNNNNNNNIVVNRDINGANWTQRHRRFRNRINRGRRNNVNRPVDVIVVDPLYPRDPDPRDDPGYASDN